MNSLEAVEKLRIRHEQEAQQCIEIFRSFCQWYQSQYNFEQIESTFWNACIYLIEKHDLSEEKLIDFFLSAYFQFLTTVFLSADAFSSRLQNGVYHEKLQSPSGGNPGMSASFYRSTAGRCRMERFPASCRLYQHSVRGFHLLESGMDDEKGDHHLERKHLDDRNGCIQGYACPPDQQ